ncbi:MAG: radical SAM protein [Candidatus Caldatribacteriota bacterium]|nr:radical SAM protein [Atribacterota bacterium]MDD4765591.1 radical SAM protein [Atribacterota bacterium]MDD5635877.1 radical SAM protein [Atribacterota bacterium]
MENKESYIVFGPVPSRRLGKSLGVNNIPPKICTYSCVYCQVGKTLKMEAERSLFYDTTEVVREIEEEVKKFQQKNETIDYISFVPDGEPTLDLELGEKIRKLKHLGIKIAVISNASLIWQEKVREDLKEADWVSLKVDALIPSVWRKVDRPHRSLELKNILEGIKVFSKDFQGSLNTETMLVRDMNDREEELHKIAGFIKELNAHRCYISIPTRPPTIKWIQPPLPEKITVAYNIFQEYGLSVECLLGFAVQSFGFTGDIERDILSITAVHPMRESEIQNFLKKAGSDWEVIKNLIKDKKLIKTSYGNQKFYMRNFAARKGD